MISRSVGQILDEQYPHGTEKRKIIPVKIREAVEATILELAGVSKLDRQVVASKKREYRAAKAKKQPEAKISAPPPAPPPADPAPVNPPPAEGRKWGGWRQRGQTEVSRSSSATSVNRRAG
jgi:hypothetical protein